MHVGASTMVLPTFQLFSGATAPFVFQERRLLGSSQRYHLVRTQRVQNLGLFQNARNGFGKFGNFGGSTRQNHLIDVTGTERSLLQNLLNRGYQVGQYLRHTSKANLGPSI